MRSLFCFSLSFLFSFSGFSQYRLEEDFSKSFNCMAYSVWENDRKLELNPDIQTALGCAIAKPIISQQQGLLIYLFENVVYSYSFRTKQSKEIARLPENPNGISDFLMSEKETALAFCVMQQDSAKPQKEIVTMFCLRLRNAEVVDSRILPLRVNYFCTDGLCYNSAGEDFWFEDEGSLGYQTYTEDPYDLPRPDSEKILRLY